MAGDIGKTVRGFFDMHVGSARNKTIRKRVLEGAKIDGIHMCQLIAAMLIACIGLNVDSTEAIIGAMLICPIMGSVIAMAYAIASVDHRLFRDAVLGLLIQIAVCLATSTLYFVISPLSNTTSELLTNSSATIWDVIIAVVGGFAGAVGISRKQEPATLIAGVAVATALKPPLCSTGFGIAKSNYPLAAAAFYEFLINVVFIGFGAELVLVLLRVPLQRDLDGDGVVTEYENAEAERRSRVLHRRLIIVSLIFALPCLFFSERLVQKSMLESGSLFEVIDTYETELTTKELKILRPDLQSFSIGKAQSYDPDNDTLSEKVVAMVTTSDPVDEHAQQEMEDLIRLHASDLDSVTFEVTKE